MITEEMLQQVYQKNAAEKWSYPQLFDALKAAGVDRYEVNVLTHQITYVGGGASVVHAAPEGFQPLTLGESFNVPGVKKALGRIQQGETNYMQFLGEIAAAGIPFYRVDMRPRTVTYHGQNRSDKLIEKVP